MKENNKRDANAQIYDAIQRIAWHHLVNPRTKVVENTEKIFGRVVKIHTEKDDALCGTVDVQEYVDSSTAINGETGLHRGVFLSAIQNNERGVVIIPFLHSEVIVETDPVTLQEYVTHFSHADKISMDAHQEIIIGVTETKDWDDKDDTPDYDNLEKTGASANTRYTPTSILHVVANSDDAGEQSRFEITADKILSEHDKAQFLIDAEQLLAKYNKTEIIIRDDRIEAKSGGGTEIVIKDDGVYMGDGGATEPAVLGDQLAALMDEWLTAMTSMMTTTMMGPQPPLNLAQFISLQSKVKAYRSSVSGFLSKKVKIAK